MLARSEAQMSLPPTPPGRVEAMNKLNPSLDSMGQPSPWREFIASTGVATPNSGVEGLPLPLPPAEASSDVAPTTAKARMGTTVRWKFRRVTVMTCPPECVGGNRGCVADRFPANHQVLGGFMMILWRITGGRRKLPFCRAGHPGPR